MSSCDWPNTEPAQMGICLNGSGTRHICHMRSHIPRLGEGWACVCISDALIVTDCLSPSYTVPAPQQILLAAPSPAMMASYSHLWQWAPPTGTERLLFVRRVRCHRCTCGSMLVRSTSALHPALRLIEADGGVEEGEGGAPRVAVMKGEKESRSMSRPSG